LFIPNRINSYLTRLSSHPGRVVNAVVDRSKKLGKLDINYTIEELQRSHHSVYLQYANSGTKTTGEWVSRLGYTNNQFSQNDDVFRLDLVTADFGKTKTSQTSYERPLIYPDYLKAKVGGSWSEYKGQSNRVTTIDFDGSSWNLNAELSARPWMPWGYLLDWKTGLNLSEVESNSNTLSQFGSAKILSPYFTLFMQKPGSMDILNVTVGIRSNVYSIPSEQMNALGRSNAEDKPLIMHFGFNRSMLLEQLVFRDAWSQEENRKRFHLAHELSFSLQGQYTLVEDRLIPQEQFSVGGIYSVRGYPSSVASGDNGYFTSLEYKFYPNRIFLEEDESSQNGPLSKVFGQKNVNTTFRIFTDFGQVFYNESTFGEEDKTLWSGGVGIDGAFYKLLNCRVDIATPFQSLESGGLKVDGADFGDLHIHFSGTLYY
jgi:hemolysin activation/secretion protein